MNTTMQINLDEKTRKQAEIILKKSGLDFSTSINFFLKEVIRNKGIPFTIKTENGFTLSREKQILKEIKQAKKKAKRFTSVDELMDDLEK